MRRVEPPAVDAVGTFVTNNVLRTPEPTHGLNEPAEGGS